MTREETKKCIEIMQAYVDGKKIEVRIGTGTFIHECPAWFWNDKCDYYRIKEEPREEVAEGFTAKEVEENFNEKFTQFYVGDCVYSSFHNKEGSVLGSSNTNVSVEFEDKSTVTFGAYHNTPSIHFLSKINKPTGFQKEPKPFDWRGKNIQWVKHKNYDAALKVVYLSDVGIGMTNLYTNDKEELNAPEVWPWEKAKAWFEWSEDNQTWRKFE